MAADIDTRSLATFSSLSETAITTLLDQPTADLVHSFLQSIAGKVKEYDQLKSQKIKAEVELETLVRTSESKTKVLQNSRDKALSDVSKLRDDLQSSENTRIRVEAELEQLRSATSNESSEITTLKSRIASLEASKQDTVNLLESRSSSNEKLLQDISSQREKAAELRRQIQGLEQAVQASNSALTSAKFKEQSLQQEFDLVKKHNEFLENERQIKSEEHAAFRKEKNARIAELTRQSEQQLANIDTLMRLQTSLQSQLDEQLSNYEKAIQEAQSLREAQSIATEQYQQDLAGTKRLAELREAQAQAEKERVQQLQQSLEEEQDRAAEEVGQLRAEVETEHGEREAAEQRVQELETKIENLQNESEEARTKNARPPTTFALDEPSTPVRARTPNGIFSPITSRLRTAMSSTQVYSEYKKVERELSHERRNNQELQRNLDAMLEDLESNKPEIEELRSDHARLRNEIDELSALVEKADRARDSALSELRASRGQVEGLLKEHDMNLQQARDDGAKIRRLLLHIRYLEQGQSISTEDAEELEQQYHAAQQQEMSGLSPTQRIVNEKLLVFKNIAELEEKNKDQLQTIRNLVDRLESTEAEATAQELQSLKQELESAKRKIEAYQAEIKGMVTQSNAYVKERNMFRDMLTRRGHHLPGQVDPSDFARSLPLTAMAPPPRAFDESSQVGADSDYAKVLKDLQNLFDSYKTDAALNSKAMKDQVNELTQRNAQLQTDVSRATGQLTAAAQRAEMVQSNYNMLKTENAELQKRSLSNLDSLTKQELKTQETVEELVEARNQVESLRRESANLNAEKDLSRMKEQRLLDDAESLRNDRARLEQLTSSLQTMLNEREQADSEMRRMLQEQVQTLEAELQSTHRKLDAETEESRKFSQRRDYEHEQNQKRIDDLVSSLSSTKEELASAKTSRDHLQARVDELTVELRSAEERIAVLTKPANEQSQDSAQTADDGMSREQELEVEVSELKRDLTLNSAELERANEQIEVYKNISQASEERLQEISETEGQYREEMEAAIAEKDSKIKDLEQRVEDISAELNNTNTQLSKLRDEQSEAKRKLEEQKSTFETEIGRLRGQEEQAKEQAALNLEATKIQAQIATDAQQNYEKELLHHAEARKALQAARSESTQLREAQTELRTRAESALADLQEKESSWTELRGRYEREVEDIKQRREEIAKQNSLLHGQLEHLTQQVTALQRDRAVLAENHANEGPDSGLENLQEVIKYLRREKEIVDVQYHLSTQEAKRLRQQLDFAQSQLDETRLKLEQQRRAELDAERNASSHTKLMETLNELNLYRESSVTLRTQAQQASQALVDKSKRVDELEESIQPLQARIAELENLSELREGEMKLLQEDRDHWQQRTQNILSKYDRVDPAEMVSLKDSLSKLEQERDEAIAAKDELQKQIDAHPEQVEAAKQDLRTRIGEQFKARSKQQSDKIKEKQTEVDTLQGEKQEMQAELESLKEQLEQAQSSEPPAVSGEQSDAPQTGEAGDGSNVAALVSRIHELEANLSQKEQELSVANLQGEEKFKSKEAELKATLNKRLQEVKTQAEAAKSAALDDLRGTLEAEHQQALEDLRAKSVPVASELQKNLNGDAETQSGVDQSSEQAPAELNLLALTEEQARMLVQKNETIRNILKTNIRKSVEKEKEALRKELAVNQTNSEEPLSAQRIEALEKDYAQKKNELIEQKDQELAAERERMIQEHEANLAEALENQKSELSRDLDTKIAEEKAKASEMAKKESSLKLNITQNKERNAQAKLDVVKKAAEETPQKPVVEVWEVAKDAKSVPVKPAAVPPQAVAASPSKPQPAPAAPTADAAKPQPTPAVANADAAQQPATNGVVNTDKASSEIPAEAKAGVDEQQTVPKPTPDATSKAVQQSTTTDRQVSSGLPQARGGSIRGGRGGLPQPQSATNRGTGIPRGRGGGRGMGRANAQNVQTNIAPSARGGGSASPSRGNLNPAAQQFTPGGKRTREDGDGAEAGNQGKRIRGGGTGGA